MYTYTQINVYMLCSRSAGLSLDLEIERGENIVPSFSQIYHLKKPNSSPQVEYFFILVYVLFFIFFRQKFKKFEYLRMKR